MKVLNKKIGVGVKKLLSGALIAALVISNALFGFPIDFFINKINESKIVDNLYWAMKDADVVDRGEVNIPTVVKQALAAQSTIDNTVSTAATEHISASSKTVFISQSTGYAFYVNSTGVCAYSKTIDSGASWETAVTVDAQTDCTSIAVWYDQWTPGDAGTRIHIATIDIGADDIWYRSFNTVNDTFDNAVFNISDNAAYAGSLAAGANFVSITKSTTGALYAATMDASDSIVMRCVATCTTDGNWSESSPTFALGNDPPILLPQASGAVMLLQWDVSADDLQHKIFNGSTWDGSWTTIETNAADNTTYDASFGAVIDPSSFEVYLVSADDHSTLGTDDDVKVWRRSGGSWSARTDVVTNSACAGVSNCGITGAKTAWDETTGYLYVIYTARSTAGTATTGNVYWKYSTDGGSTWSAEFGPVYSSNDNIYGTNVSFKPTANERIFATWYAATPDDLFGRPIAPKTFEQSAYRVFANADSADVGAALAAQDTAATLSASGAAFRLRVLLHIGVSDLFTNEESFKLQFAQQSGTCDTGFSGESYADVTGATMIAYNDNATPADGAALTANANDPTHSGHTIVNQTYEETNNFTNSQGVINVGQDGKWDFSLKDNSAPASTAYCFRVVKSDGALFSTYSVIPQITTAAVATLPIFTQKDYRWFNNADSLQPGSALTIENATGTLVSTSTLVRLRVNVSVSNASMDISSTAFKLQFTTSTSSSWRDVGEVGSTEIWRFKDNTSAASGTPFTSLLLGASDVIETYEEQNPTALNTSAIPVGQEGEWDFALDPAYATTGIAYYFRMVKSDGETFTTDGGGYTTLPAIVIGITYPATGTLRSPVFDTGAINGASYNSILVQGPPVAGTKVRIRFGTSNGTATSSFSFIGPDCTSGTYYYDSALPATDESKELQCYSQHNNRRYFRYEIILCSANNCVSSGTVTPQVDAVIVNWSP